MNSRLKYKAEQYHNKLTEYAAYTIDVVTPVGTFRQKANKQEDVIVIDEGHGHFRIYMSYEQIGHFVGRPFRNPEMTKDFSTSIKIVNEEVIIKVNGNNFDQLYSISWYIFLGVIALVNLANKQPLFLLLLLPLIPVIHLLQKVKKKGLERLLVNFLNTIVTL